MNNEIGTHDKALHIPEVAAEYLKAALESGDEDIMLTALLNIADAYNLDRFVQEEFHDTPGRMQENPNKGYNFLESRKMKLKEKNGILYPDKMKTGSWIITGTPGSGKSHMVNKIHGWPGELGIDISMDKWWKVQPLTHRPREIHFALPFKGMNERYTVHDELWEDKKKYPDVEWERIKIPGEKKFILASDWRARFVFDFILPPPAHILAQRKSRYASKDKRLMDSKLSKKQIQWQTHVYWQLAWFFHKSGLQVIVRPFNSARPYSFSVLKKISRNKNKVSKKEITPDTDWSKEKNVKAWLQKSAPKDLIKKLKKS